MLNKPITYTYTDDEGNEQTETESYWFHISKREMLKLQAEFDGGIQGLLNAFRGETDPMKLFQFFENIILLSHGIRIDNGRRFDKSTKVQEEFLSSAAFEALFEDLTMGEQADKSMAEFIKGVFPPDMITISEKALEEAGGDMDKALATLEGQAKEAVVPQPNT